MLQPCISSQRPSATRHRTRQCTSLVKIYVPSLSSTWLFANHKSGLCPPYKRAAGAASVTYNKFDLTPGYARIDLSEKMLNLGFRSLAMWLRLLVYAPSPSCFLAGTRLNSRTTGSLGRHYEDALGTSSVSLPRALFTSPYAIAMPPGVLFELNSFDTSSAKHLSVIEPGPVVTPSHRFCTMQVSNCACVGLASG